MERFLSASARTELLARHRREREGRIKDRIKVVVLRDDGWSYESIAEALFLSDESVRQQIQDYIKSAGKKLAPSNGGSQSFLNQEQTQAVVAHLESHLYATVSDICQYVPKTYSIRYSISGMTDWLEKNKVTFHNPCGVLSKACQEDQIKFGAHYEKLKRPVSEGDPIIFIDGVHPPHAVRFTKGWIKKGLRKEIPTNGSQKRLNSLGALDLEKMKLHNQSYETMNGANIIAFLVYLLGVMPRGIIHVILDQARYHTCKEVKNGYCSIPGYICIIFHRIVQI